MEGTTPQCRVRGLVAYSFSTSRVRASEYPLAQEVLRHAMEDDKGTATRLPRASRK